MPDGVPRARSSVMVPILSPPDMGRSLPGAIMASAMLISGCGGDPSAPGQTDTNALLTCSIDESLIVSGGVGRNGVPSLQDPLLVGPSSARAEYLLPKDRVIGIEVDGQYVAIPHNILWWHEIVNFDDLGVPLAVTYCPLTGSSVVFNRSSGVDGSSFGVSGLLFLNNLIMFNRSEEGATESLFPQMMRGGRCGPLDGQALTMYPAVEMRWESWRSLHPETRVVGEIDDPNRDYRVYPYGNYESYVQTLYPQTDIDGRRYSKERVLGIPGAGGSGLAFPFTALSALAGVDGHAVVRETVDGEPVVVFWNGAARSAIAFRPTVDGQTLTFETSEAGYMDVETGSSWTLDGLALSGAFAGRTLEMFPEAYVSFWFAWAAFHPETILWTP